jgi:hypothetical protein
MTPAPFRDNREFAERVLSQSFQWSPHARSIHRSQAILLDFLVLMSEIEKSYQLE